jgi:hypothetical protein
VLAAAAAAGVCSFAQTLEAARSYLLGEGGTRLHTLACKASGARVPPEALRSVTLEGRDEGPAATVLLAQLVFNDRAPQAIALLVARDFGTAAARLSAQASDLRVWHRLAPTRAAAVFDESTGTVRWFGQVREVAVIAAQWCDGRALAPTAAELGLAWRDGAALDEARARDAAGKLAETRSALATFAADGACERTVDLAQGDVMVSSAGSLVLVGSAARSWWGPLGAWPYRLAACGGAATEPGLRPQRIAMLEHAVLSGLEAIAGRREGGALLSAMLAQAAQPEVGARALVGHIADEERGPVAALVQALLPAARARLLR